MSKPWFLKDEATRLLDDCGANPPRKVEAPSGILEWFAGVETVLSYDRKDERVARLYALQDAAYIRAEHISGYRGARMFCASNPNIDTLIDVAVRRARGAGA